MMTAARKIVGSDRRGVCGEAAPTASGGAGVVAGPAAPTNHGGAK